MKRIITILLAAAMLCSAAYASEPNPEGPALPSAIVLSGELEVASTAESPAVLRDVRLASENGQNLLIKTWEVPAGYDPEQLTEADMEKGGYRYKKSYTMLVSESSEVDTKLDRHHHPQGEGWSRRPPCSLDGV